MLCGQNDTEYTMSFLILSCVMCIISLVRSCFFTGAPYYLNTKVLIIPKIGPLINMNMFWGQKRYIRHNVPFVSLSLPDSVNFKKFLWNMK